MDLILGWVVVVLVSIHILDLWVSFRSDGKLDKGKEIFYLMTDSTHFIYGYMASDKLDKSLHVQFYYVWFHFI